MKSRKAAATVINSNSAQPKAERFNNEIQPQWPLSNTAGRSACAATTEGCAQLQMAAHYAFNVCWKV